MRRAHGGVRLAGEVSLLQPGFVPLYHQLRELLTEKIESGEWTPGYQLPGENQLTAEFGVSRFTVRQALGLLEKQGLVERKRGKGSFVARPKYVHNLLLNGAIAGIQPQKITLHHIGKIVPPVKIAGELQLPDGEETWELRRSIAVSGEPIVFVRSWLPVRMFPDFDEYHPDVVPMQRILRYNYAISTLRQHKEIQVTTLDDEEARVLSASVGMPALLLTYTNISQKSAPYEYRKVIVRGDRSKYYVDVDMPEMLV
jgi:GntR family transcriptional regulator